MPNATVSHLMRANVLSGLMQAWEVGPRSAAEHNKAAKHYKRAAELHPARAKKAELKRMADVAALLSREM